MRKFIKVVPLLVLVFVCCFFFPSQAGEWRQDQTGWQYILPGEEVQKGCWFYIRSKWYYFHSNGYMAHDQWIGDYYVGNDGAMYRERLTPDNYWVNCKGKWVKDYYCKDLYEYCPDIAVNAHVSEIVDKGAYYEMPVSISGYARYIHESTGPGTIARVSKNAKVLWQDEQGQRRISFSEYIKIIKKLYKNLDDFRMVTPAQDANGYIIGFADGFYS